MKNYILLLLIACLCLFSINALAFTVPNKPINNGYVLDQSGKLSSLQIEKLNSKIDNLNKTTKNEYAIVVLSTLDGVDIADAAQDTFRKWGVGKSNLNNGVLVMVAVAERKSRIATGKNVEGDLPDLLCKDILDKTLKPYLKKGDFYGGFDATIDALSSHIESREKEKAVVAAPTEAPNAVSNTTDVPVNTSNGDGYSALGVLLVLIVLGVVVFGVVLFFSSRSAEKRRQRMEKLDAEHRKSLRLKQEAQAVRESQAARERAQKAKIESKPLVQPIPVPMPVSVPIKPHYRSDGPILPKASKPVDKPSVSSNLGTTAVVGATVAAAAVAAAELAKKRAAEAELARQRDEEARTRRRREQAEADQRQKDEESRRSNDTSSSWSSTSSSSWGSGSSSGFGGGDSGGGGASSDW